MKKNITLFTLGLLLSGSVVADAPKQEATQVAKKDVRIGYVDAFKIMQESKFGSQTGEELMKTQKAWAEEINQRGKDFEQARMAFERKRPTMSQDAIIKEESRLKKEQIELQAYIEEKNQEFQRQQTKATESILAQIKEAAAEVAKTEKLDVVVDKTTGQTLWSSDQADLSNKLIACMDKKFSANSKNMVADNKKSGKNQTA